MFGRRRRTWSLVVLWIQCWASFRYSTYFFCSSALLTERRVLDDNVHDNNDSDNSNEATITTGTSSTTNPREQNDKEPSSSQQQHYSNDDNEDSVFDPLQADPDCEPNADDCWSPPASTLDQTSTIAIDASSSYGGNDPSEDEDDNDEETCRLSTNDEDNDEGKLDVDDNDETTHGKATTDKEKTCASSNTTKKKKKEKKVVVDKHWGRDPTILKMRDRLRESGSGQSNRYKLQDSEKDDSDDGHASTDEKRNEQQQPLHEKDSDSNAQDNNGDAGSSTSNNKRPPIFLVPGLASTRLVAWKHKICENPFLSDIKVSDTVWLNMALIVQMGLTVDVRCMIECLQLGWNQTDSDDYSKGCKLRPDEGLDSISSLSPGTGIPTKWLVGGTNTVYAWLVQWLAEHLGYDVTHLIGLPYDWRLSPDRMEARDGFLTLMRRRIEAAVQHADGTPGIIVAHSMGNAVFRYFLIWLHRQLQRETYQKLLHRYRERRNNKHQRGFGTDTNTAQQQQRAIPTSYVGWAATKVEEFLRTSASSKNSDDSNEANKSDEQQQHKHHSSDRNIDKDKEQLWELAQLEGTAKYHDWLTRHLWTYIGLSAPMLGAVGPLRAVISGENMGVPWEDAEARKMEITFGSTHTVNPISSKMGFCDNFEFDEWGDEPELDSQRQQQQHADLKLACLDDIATEVEMYLDSGSHLQDPWKNYPALKALLRDRVDWNSDRPILQVVREYCRDPNNGKSPQCEHNTTRDLGPQDVQSGHLFDALASVWHEEGNPLQVKKEQLADSFWYTDVPNMLNSTWNRPLIKHVILAYGVDVATEAGYTYRKRETLVDKEKAPGDAAESPESDEPKGKNSDKNEKQFDGVPDLFRVIWEEPGGKISQEQFDSSRGGLGDILGGGKKKKIRQSIGQGRLNYSGDGTIPYLSLIWAHTWLLHAARALRHDSGDTDNISTITTPTDSTTISNPLEGIEISHRPKGGTEWIEGPPPPTLTATGEKRVEESSDTGTKHPHGTKYKPEMTRFHSAGTSRTTGIEYTTTVIEAVGVEHKETTRNYDILAAVFTDVLRKMHDDLEIL